MCEGLSFAGQTRNAIPDFEHDTLYLETSRGSYNTSYMRHVIHHEFFHIIDFVDDGELYEDRTWKALNPANFNYGRGGSTAQGDPQTSVLTKKYPGFLNHYSTTGVEEDKAEIFASLVANQIAIRRRAESDAVLRAKVDRMKSLTLDFCPEMNEQFWKTVGAQR